ncbi:hypothetical protein FEM48_Zijuj03G0172500 [Ziziphus jujuba var. spinosa]|uniref:Uncharacterized protein n=1 Tax=Ziziphus jujuba var. spinosa TaxID=714518 RepID=A0A978VRL4_ZIZJJ|nr:hypothetical protein FEM48_Zijuj03G0172500 [Ziziphus jujuba var. spinosa]
MSSQAGNVRTSPTSSKTTNWRILFLIFFLFSFGEELLNWTLKFTSLDDISISTTNAKCHAKVEAFALTANYSRISTLLSVGYSGGSSTMYLT